MVAGAGGLDLGKANSCVVKTVRILLADDHKVVRHGTRALLSTIPEWEIVGEVDNGRDAVVTDGETKTGHRHPGYQDAPTERIRCDTADQKDPPETEILIFTAHEAEKLVHDVFDSGARSYIMKTDAADHLIEAMKALSEHKHFFTSRISEIVFARYIKGKQAARIDARKEPDHRSGAGNRAASGRG